MEYTLENVKCPECGHSAEGHLKIVGCGCVDVNLKRCLCNKNREQVLFHHLNAVAKERDAALRQADYFSGQLLEGPQYGGKEDA